MKLYYTNVYTLHFACIILLASLPLFVSSSARFRAASPFVKVSILTDTLRLFSAKAAFHSFLK